MQSYQKKASKTIENRRLKHSLEIRASISQKLEQSAAVAQEKGKYDDAKEEAEMDAIGNRTPLLRRSHDPEDSYVNKQ